MVLAAQQKASLLQQTWIREALTLRANIVDSPHDQSPPLFVEKGTNPVSAQIKLH